MTEDEMAGCPLRGPEGVPGLPGAPQDEAGLTRMLPTVFLQLRGVRGTAGLPTLGLLLLQCGGSREYAQ